MKPLEVNDENRRQSPDLELLGGELALLAGGAVVLLVLAELLLTGEGLQTLD